MANMIRVLYHLFTVSFPRLEGWTRPPAAYLLAPVIVPIALCLAAMRKEQVAESAKFVAEARKRKLLKRERDNDLYPLW